MFDVLNFLLHINVSLVSFENNFKIYIICIHGNMLYRFLVKHLCYFAFEATADLFAEK